MENNPLKKIRMLGQSIWLDYICRDLIVSGDLGRLIDEDGLRGITSNPSIFEKAIAGSHDYDTDIRAMVRKDRMSIQSMKLSAKGMFRAPQMCSCLYTTRPKAQTAILVWK